MNLNLFLKYFNLRKKQQLDVINKHFLFIKKILPIILLVFIFILLIGTFRYYLSQVLLKNMIYFKSVYGVYYYFELISMFGFFKWLVYVFSLICLPFWYIISYLLYQLIRFLSNLIYSIYTKEDPIYVRNKIRIERFLYEKISKYLVIYFLFFIVLFAIFITITQIFYKPLEEIFIYSLIFTSLGIIPVWVIVWCNYLIIRKKRRNKLSFDNYLFSKSTIRNRFKEIFSILIFFALFGWLLIPFLLKSFDYTESYAEKLMLDFSYKDKLEIIKSEGFDNYNDMYSKLNLPNPAELKKDLSVVSQLHILWNSKNALKLFQQGLFFIITLGAFLDIGIPSVLNALFYKSKRKALKLIFYTTLKSTAIILILQLIISNLFFIDVSDYLGIGTIFLFIMTFLLMQSSTNIESINKNSSLQSS